MDNTASCQGYDVVSPRAAACLGSSIEPMFINTISLVSNLYCKMPRKYYHIFDVNYYFVLSFWCTSSKMSLLVLRCLLL